MQILTIDGFSNSSINCMIYLYKKRFLNSYMLQFIKKRQIFYNFIILFSITTFLIYLFASILHHPSNSLA